MSRFDGGWIKIYRAAIEGDIGENSFCLAIFLRLIAWANLQPTIIRFNGVPREIPRGALVVGLRDLASKVGCSKDTANRHLIYLEKRDTIRRDVATEGTLVTIINFDRYQCIENSVIRDQDKEDTLTGRDPGRCPAPIEEVKKEERRNKNKYSCSFDLEKAYQNYPLKQGKTPGLKKLAKEIRTEEDYQNLLVAIDRYSRSKKVAEGYIKLFSTFASEWRDWVSAEAGTIAQPANIQDADPELVELERAYAAARNAS